jgi:uncharacterized protein YcbK (DUF882 family)
VNGSTVKVYSRAKNGEQRLSPHFRVREFASTDGTDTVFVSPALVEVLEKVRVHFGKPVIVNSGYRTEVRNQQVGGAAYSQHKYGLAADITVRGVEPKAVAAYAESLMPDFGGIGIYPAFTHIDVRETKSRWNG